MYDDYRRIAIRWSRYQWRATKWFPRQKVAENLSKILSAENERIQRNLNADLNRSLAAMSLVEKELENDLQSNCQFQRKKRRDLLQASASELISQRRKSRMVDTVYLNSDFLKKLHTPQIGAINGHSRITDIQKNRFPLRKTVHSKPEEVSRLILFHSSYRFDVFNLGKYHEGNLNTVEK